MAIAEVQTVADAVFSRLRPVDDKVCAMRSDARPVARVAHEQLRRLEPQSFECPEPVRNARHCRQLSNQFGRSAKSAQFATIAHWRLGFGGNSTTARARS